METNVQEDDRDHSSGGVPAMTLREERLFRALFYKGLFYSSPNGWDWHAIGRRDSSETKFVISMGDSAQPWAWRVRSDVTNHYTPVCNRMAQILFLVAFPHVQ
jgi:hypothetical protein